MFKLLFLSSWCVSCMLQGISWIPILQDFCYVTPECIPSVQNLFGPLNCLWESGVLILKLILFWETLYFQIIKVQFIITVVRNSCLMVFCSKIIIKLLPIVILIQYNKNDNNALAPCPISASEAFLGNNSSMSEGSWLKFDSVRKCCKD